MAVAVVVAEAEAEAEAEAGRCVNDGPICSKRSTPLMYSSHPSAANAGAELNKSTQILL